MNKILVCLGLFLLTFCFGSTASALTKTVPALFDSYTYNNSSGGGYGIYEHSYAQHFPQLGNYRNAFFNFDVDVIPVNAIISNAVFKPYLAAAQLCTNHDNLPLKLAVYKITGSWTEHGLTWENSPNYISTSIASRTVPITQEPGYLSFNVTYAVKDWFENKENRKGLMVKYVGDSGDNSCVAQFYTRETSDQNKRPVIEVTYSIPLVQITPPSGATVRSIDTTPPVISGVTVYDKTPTSAKIKWNTDEEATSIVKYGIPQGFRITSGTYELLTSHLVEITGLSPETEYEYQVSSEDSSGNEKVFQSLTFTTPSPPIVINSPEPDPDTAPVISDITTTILNTREIKTTWSTDTNSSSWMFVSSQATEDTPLEEFNIIHGINNSVFNHEVVIDYLSPGLTYQYRVFSMDAEGNQAVSSLETFKMPALGAFTGNSVELPETPEGTAAEAGVIPSSSSDGGNIGNGEEPQNSDTAGGDPASDFGNNADSPVGNQNRNLTEEELMKEIIKDVKENSDNNSYAGGAFIPFFGIIVSSLLMPLLFVGLIVVVIILLIKLKQRKNVIKPQDGAKESVQVAEAPDSASK